VVRDVARVQHHAGVHQAVHDVLGERADDQGGEAGERGHGCE
jgi:hypothetical protein